MHPADIVAALHKKGVSLARLAREHNLAASTLSAALRRPQLNAEPVIIAALEMPPQTIWPDRYDASGRRTILRGNPRHREMRAAA